MSMYIGTCILTFCAKLKATSMSSATLVHPPPPPPYPRGGFPSFDEHTKNKWDDRFKLSSHYVHIFIQVITFLVKWYSVADQSGRDGRGHPYQMATVVMTTCGVIFRFCHYCK
jgi:hypothetical protein